MQILQQIQQATIAARTRTGDASIGTRCARGLFDVVRVTYSSTGTSTVQVVSAGLDAKSVVAHLNGLQ